MRSMVVLLITDLLSSAFCGQSTVTGGRMVDSQYMAVTVFPSNPRSLLSRKADMFTNNYNVKQKVIGFAIKPESCEC